MAYAVSSPSPFFSPFSSFLLLSLLAPQMVHDETVERHPLFANAKQWEVVPFYPNPPPAAIAAHLAAISARSVPDVRVLAVSCDFSVDLSTICTCCRCSVLTVGLFVPGECAEAAPQY
eukprot:1432843-Rhodomonas_salina.3